MSQWVHFQLQFQTSSLTSCRESKNILTHNCRNSVFQSFYFFVSITLDLLSHCRPLALDEYFSSSMLSLWKQNQWKMCIFPYLTSIPFCPFHLLKAVLHITISLLNHDELQAHLRKAGWTTQPFIAPSSVLSCKFPPEFLDSDRGHSDYWVPQCT